MQKIAFLLLVADREAMLMDMIRAVRNYLVIICVLGISPGYAQEFCEQELVPESQVPGFPAIASGAWFGNAVDIDGHTAVVGAESDSFLAPSGGTAHVFSFQNGQWRYVQPLYPNDVTANKAFGSTVAVSGNTIAIGAYLDSEASGFAGAVYVYQFDGVSWNQERKLVATDGGWQSRLGWSVDIQGDVIVAGAPEDSEMGTLAGAIYVFVRDGKEWREHQKLVPQTPGGRLGSDVSIYGNTLAVGASSADGMGSNSGAVFVYRNTRMGWELMQELTASDAVVSQFLGRNVVVSENSIIASAHGDGEALNNAGAVYVFEKENGQWEESQKLTAQEPESSARFGSSVAMYGNWAVVGARYHLGHGVAYLFQRTRHGWAEADVILPGNMVPGAQFGIAVAMSDAHIVVGESQLSLEDAHGHAHVYSRLCHRSR